MNPKEKAKELVDKFEKQIYNEFATDEKWFNCICCALIAVDEILEIDMFDMSQELFENHCDYWQDVKTEIEKI